MSDSGQKVVVKIAGSSDCNQFLENEATNIGLMKDKFPKSSHGRHFPVLLDSFQVVNTGNRLAVNVFERLEGYITLTEVLRMFKEARAHIDVKSAAWMYNRILESLAHSGPLDIVHGGVHPDNILIDPPSHCIVLTGWTSSLQLPGKVAYANPTYLRMYPQEVVGKKDGRTAHLSTDLFMAAASIVEVLGGDVASATLPFGVPKEIRAFLNARLTRNVGLRDAKAIDQRDRFGEVLKALFGPPQFHEFVLPFTSRR
jgi:serine/threonine protein kinase